MHISICQHQHHYCEQCLDEYTIYRINQFQEVVCPNPFCDIPIDTKGQFFKQLPSKIQQRYAKIHQFHLTHKDPNSKLCPAENCEGIIRKDDGSNTMTCDTCNVKFCSECLFVDHDGLCD